MAGVRISTPESPLRLEPLAPHHDTAGFDCGPKRHGPIITRYFREEALGHHALGICAATVTTDREVPARVAGFFTLSPVSVRVDASVLKTLGLAEAPYKQIGGYLLGRLGVDQRYKGEKLGPALVSVALSYAADDRRKVGGLFLAVDPKDPWLAHWYEGFGFTQVSSTGRMIRRLE